MKNTRVGTQVGTKFGIFQVVGPKLIKKIALKLRQNRPGRFELNEKYHIFFTKSGTVPTFSWLPDFFS